MARTDDTAEADNLRRKAFELYATLLPDGSRRRLKDIQNELGVSQPRVSYWLKQDRWLERVARQELDIVPLPKDPTSEDIRSLLRNGLGSHIRTLSSIIDGTGSDRVRVAAIAEYAKIAKVLGALDFGSGPSTGVTHDSYAFDDTVDVDGQVDTQQG